MVFREATIFDIEQIQIVRNAVKENVLSDPSKVSDQDCIEFITQRGKGWVCEFKQIIVGFSIVDLSKNNVWALFVHPDFENKKIGFTLHNIMLDWYFSKTRDTLWLGTGFNTRAEGFYRKLGWKETGMHGTQEIKFEMSYQDWNQINQN
jgi:GNAT superfamily N-acetyltransferase